MKKFLIILFTLGLGVSAYAKSKVPETELKIGVSSQQIEALLGKPDKIMFDFEDTLTWIYDNAKPFECKTCSGFAKDEGQIVLVIKFNNDTEVKSFSYNCARSQK